MSVNISANQLLEPGFAGIALSICDEHVVAPQMIEIEITESIFIQDESECATRINRNCVMPVFVLSFR